MILRWEWPHGLLCSFLTQTAASIKQADFLRAQTSDRASPVSITEKTLYFPAFLAFLAFQLISAGQEIWDASLSAFWLTSDDAGKKSTQDFATLEVLNLDSSYVEVSI